MLPIVKLLIVIELPKETLNDFHIKTIINCGIQVSYHVTFATHSRGMCMRF